MNVEGTIDGFRYGAVTPVAAYAMACLGGALGLHCIVRSLIDADSWKPGWLALGAPSISCGIWTMHFIAMIGFQVEETRIRYDAVLTVLSLVVAILVVGIGVFLVGYRGAGAGSLPLAGAVTGLGVAAMHYLGMAAMRLNADVGYDGFTVVLSLLIAVAAATAALWAAQHYTAMAAVDVHLHDSAAAPWSGDSPPRCCCRCCWGRWCSCCWRAWW